MVAIGLSLATGAQADRLFVALVENVVGPVAVFLLRLFGNAAAFTGNVIVDPAGTTSVTVTRACDGHGLMAVLLGILLGWTVRTTPLMRVLAGFLGGVLFIVAFNIVRIAALFVFRGGEAETYEITHNVVFAVFSVWLVGAIVVAAQSRGRLQSFISGPELMRFAPALVVTTAAWVLFGSVASERALTPLIDLVFSHFGPAGLGGLRFEAGRAYIDTLLVARRSPLGFLTQPFDLSAFLLPLPVAVAAIAAAARRPVASVILLVGVIAVGVTTATLAAISGIAEEAERIGVTEMAVIVGPQQVDLVRSTFPRASDAAALDRVRNTLVHMNLFVFPLLVFPFTRRPMRSRPGERDRPRPRIEPAFSSELGGSPPRAET